MATQCNGTRQHITLPHSRAEGVLQERAIDFAAFFDEGCQVDGLGRTVKAQATVEEVVGLDEAIVRSIEHVEKFRSILFLSRCCMKRQGRH